MKKDYVVISEEQTVTDERTYIENFWTKRWDKRTQLPKAESVAKREEFRLMQPFLEQLPARSRILDGGCGMGEWTVFLTNLGFQVVGLDISKRTIERLEELLPNYQFVHGDIRQTEFADASFDTYFSWGTFEHFESGLGECVQEAYRILKPGRFLFVSVPFQNWRHILRDIRPLHKWDEYSDIQRGTPMRFYQWRLTRPELEQELAIRGFRVLNVIPLGKKEGLKRTLHHDFGIKRGSSLNRKITRWLRRIVPKSWVAHMIIAVAQKN